MAKKVHEWMQHAVEQRTVCGQETTAAGHLQVVHDLGKVAVASRCGNCERMRDAVGTSSTRGKGAPSDARCVHCKERLGDEHGHGCLYGGPPREKDRARTGISGRVTQADCEGQGTVHTNASLGLRRKKLPDDPAGQIRFAAGLVESIVATQVREQQLAAKIAVALAECSPEERMGVLAHTFYAATVFLHPEASCVLVDAKGRVWVKPIEAAAGRKG